MFGFTLRTPPTFATLILVCLALLYVLTAVSPAAAVPYVNFSSVLYSIVEDDVNLEVPVILSHPSPETTIRVYILFTPGTASPDDYHGNTIEVRFDPGDPLVQIAEIPIMDDLEIEDDETFTIYFQETEPEDVLLGATSEATVTIVDDDGELGLLAHFEMGDEVARDHYGRLVVATVPDEVFSVDVVVDDLPPGGGPVHIMTNTETGQYTLNFTDSSRETFSLPTADVPAGEYSATLAMQIPNSDAKKNLFSEAVAAVSFSFPTEVQHCAYCVVAYIITEMFGSSCYGMERECGYPCPDKADAQKPGAPIGDPPAIDPGTDLEILRRYRDEVLQGTEVGDFCITIYEEQSPAVVAAMLQDYSLVGLVVEAWELWLSAVAAVVDGQGSGFTITQEMQDALLAALAGFEAHGSPELATWVDSFRTELALGTIAGETAAELQSRVENDLTEVESMSWREVREIFR